MWIKKWFGPDNSLILSYDHISDDFIPEFRKQLDEVGKYYEFTGLASVANTKEKKRGIGKAVVIFEQARRSVLLRAVPILNESKIPFTLFLNTECIGLNRLPFEEEMSLLAIQEDTHYLWKNADQRAVQWQKWRKQSQPLPVESLDPTSFFATWGQLLALDPQTFDCGLYLFTHPLSNQVTAAHHFASSQMNRELKYVYSPYALEGSDATLQALGVSAAVVSELGVVKAKTPVFKMPRFKISLI